MATLELARFTMDPKNEAALLRRRPALVDALRDACPGFVSARLTRLDERTWLDVVEWGSREEAEAAQEIVQGVPAAVDFFALIDQVLAMEHAEVVDARA